MICVYHRVDFDGHCSAAIVKKKFPECELIGLQYGDDIPWDKFSKEDVIMVDFSLQPHSEMKRLINSCKTLTWIDHHASAIEDGLADFEDAKNVQGSLSTKYAGCELTWKYFFKNVKIPNFITLIGRWDIWDHKYSKDVIPFQFGLRGYETDPEEETNLEFWNDILDNEDYWINRLLNEGKVIERYQRKEWKAMAEEKAFEVSFNGIPSIALNSSSRGSDLFKGIYKPERHDLMIAFGWDGNKWTVSLYSTKEEINAGQIAKENGGVGHPGAAGFQTTKLNLIPYC